MLSPLNSVSIRVGLPVHIIEMKGCFSKIFSELTDELEREPSPLEFSERSGLPLEKVTLASWEFTYHTPQFAL